MGIAGQLKDNLSGELAYKSFMPFLLPLNPPLNLDDEILTKLARTKEVLGKLDMSINLIPNIDLLVASYVVKEALISSQIEGTQCTLDDVFDPGDNKHANLDVGDVVNYINACNYGVNRLNSLPICNRFLKELHDKLMEGVRGEDKNPGEFRRSQNWIGPKNCGLKDARYIPPNVKDMNICMNNLEEYINDGDDYDALIRIALIHYQFETIHPFLDGNGRVGRLLIVLYLLENKILSKPAIYVSYYLKKNQIEYYDRISEVRNKGNYNQWISFFLDALYEASKDSLDSILKLNELHISNINKLPSNTRKKDTLKELFVYVESHPIISIQETANDLGLSFNTIKNNINKLVELNILKETTNKQRYKTYSYEEYLSILRKDT